MLLFGCTLFVMVLAAGPAHAGGLPSPQTGVPALDVQSPLPLPALTAGPCAKAEPAATPLPDFMEPSARRLGSPARPTRTAAGRGELQGRHHLLLTKVTSPERVGVPTRSLD